MTTQISSQIGDISMTEKPISSPMNKCDATIVTKTKSSQNTNWDHFDVFNDVNVTSLMITSILVHGGLRCRLGSPPRLPYRLAPETPLAGQRRRWPYDGYPPCVSTTVPPVAGVRRRRGPGLLPAPRTPGLTPPFIATAHKPHRRRATRRRCRALSRPRHLTDRHDHPRHSSQ
jgi:hypothetical protein